MTTNNVQFAEKLLIEAAFTAMPWGAACIAVEQALQANTWPGAVVEQGAAETVIQWISYKLGTLPLPYPVWITNAGL